MSEFPRSARENSLRRTDDPLYDNHGIHIDWKWQMELRHLLPVLLTTGLSTSASVFGIGVDHLRRGAACAFVLFSRKSGINPPGLSFAGGAWARCVLCAYRQRA